MRAGHRRLFVVAALTAAALGASRQARASDEALADGGRVVHREPGMFGDVLVIDEGHFRYLRFAGLEGDDQSMIDLDDPSAVPMLYIRYAAIGLVYAERVDRVLMIGLGGGTFTGLLRRQMPGVWLDVVEIDPVVIRVAKRFFGVKEDARYRIHRADGAAFVRTVADRYDLVLIDAYSGDGIPAHLGRRAFFEDVRARMTRTGVVVVNLSVSIENERSLTRTVRGLFPNLACFRTPRGTNLLLVARVDGRMPTGAELATRAGEVTRTLGLPFDLTPIARRLGVDCD